MAYSPKHLRCAPVRWLGVLLPTEDFFHELPKKHAHFNWTDGCQETFEELKAQLTSAPILAYHLDNGEFFLETDASDWGIGVVLT